MTTAIGRGLAPERDVLLNGAVVLVKESHTTPAVTINATLRAGSIFDPPGQAGLAYLLSRVLDRGTATRTADDISEALDARGVSLTVSVTRHTMTLVCTCLSEDFEAILELVADIIRNATCPEPELGKRKSEVVTSIRQDQDSPAAVALENLMELLYGPAHPYGWRVKGTVDVVERIDRPALMSFRGTRFAPAALVLVIVGDTGTPDAVAAARRAFGTWEATAAPAAPIPPARATGGRRRLVVPMMSKAQTDIAYGFIGIRRADPAFHACSILNNVLGQYGLGGRLGDSIRERQGMAYYVFSALDANVLEGPLFIRAGVAPANVDRTIASIDAEVERLRAEGITAEELADAKRYLIGSIPRTLETNAGIASFLQIAEQFALGLDYDVRLPELLGSVKADDVKAAAARLLAPELATVVIAGPYDPA